MPSSSVLNRDVFEGSNGGRAASDLVHSHHHETSYEHGVPNGAEESRENQASSPSITLPLNTTARPPAVGYKQAPVAVIGMSCRLPGHIKTPKRFWDFMMASRVASNSPPESRFNLAGHYDGSQKPYTMKTPGAMFIDVDPSDFDAGFFGVNHMDASSMDPQQRQLMEVAYECLENAGIPLERLAGKRVGCLVGANTVDYYDMTCRDPEDRTESPTMGSNRALLSNRISHFLNVHGPSISIDTACSSTLIALDMACLYLTTNQCDMMIVGGANMYLSPERNEDMGAMRPTASATGRCHTFDSKADGYVAAEAINCVILKRVDDAVRDMDPIRAVIRGTSTNSAGRTPGIAMPDASAQAAAIRSAYRNAGISDYSETGFLECHGTGTLVGDPIEISGAAAVFTPVRKSQEPLVIGSVKSNIGHSEGAAGLSGLIKVVLALEKDMIPGTATFLSPNPRIDFEGSKVRASRTPLQWPTENKKRASINSFGFGGANAHAVVEHPQYLLPNLQPRHKSSYVDTDDIGDDFFDFEGDASLPSCDTSGLTKPVIVALSANDEDSLRAGIAGLASHLMSPAVSVTLKDLAYTLSERRSLLYHRAYSIQQHPLQSSIKISQNAFTISPRTSSKPPSIGFVFTGQGAQWPQMGKSLIEAFPVAKKMCEELDAALQTLNQPPTWSLLEELTAPRSAATFREPEFSQPLVTALQLAYLAVLSSWGIKARTAIGHSSGEIAAAAYCGHISPADAIKIAYLRGYAVQNASSDDSLSMLAVGSSVDDLNQYLRDHEDQVQIACFNSPRSLTLSGPVASLETIKKKLDTAGTFARMLLVNAAYHSQYMRSSGDRYMELMKEAIQKPSPPALTDASRPIMYSSVTSKLMDKTPGIDYWHRNMVSPVCFQQAMSAMMCSKVDGEQAIDFLVEIGPSNALSGPISQICQDLSSALATQPTYSSVAKRGPESLQSLYLAAAELFGAGYHVRLDEVNEYYHKDSEPPSVIIDLPNYAWNHTKKYWHESLASKDWRYRPFIRHDLLGSKILGTPWDSPIFRNRLRLKDNPWLRDHKLGEQVVFPGAGYVAMAIEAMYQHMYMTAWGQGAEMPESFHYCLKDIKFSRALVLDDSDSYSMISLSLTAAAGSVGTWYAFKVSSLNSSVGLKGDDVWNTHASGLIRTETDLTETVATPGMIKPLQHSVPARIWYKSMRDSGFNFGPSFQKHVSMEYTTGERKGRSIVDLVPPSAPFRQSEYLLHPACMDGCFQTVTSSVWEGDRSAVNAALVPFQIDSLRIPHRHAGEKPAEQGISNASSEYTGIGRRDIMKNYASSCQVFHPDTGSLLLEMRGLRYTELDSAKETTLSHMYAQVAWHVDIDLLTETTFTRIVEGVAQAGNDEPLSDGTSAVQRIISLAAHKMPNLNVVEISLDSTDAASLWLEHKEQSRSAFSKYRYFATDAHCVVTAREAYDATADLTAADVEFSMLDPASYFNESIDRFDLAIIKAPPEAVAAGNLAKIVSNMHSWLSIHGGWVLIDSHPTDSRDQTASVVTGTNLFHRVLMTKGLVLAYYELKKESPKQNGTCNLDETIHLVRFSDTLNTMHIDHALRDTYSYDIVSVPDPLALPARSKVLVLDEMKDEVLSKMTQYQWTVLQHLVASSCSILWVTAGAQGPYGITQPSRALGTGLFRVIRNEEPSLNLLNLDVECEPIAASSVPLEDSDAISSIAACLLLLKQQKGANSRPTKHGDAEFACRGGLLYVSRVLPDLSLNAAKEEEFFGRPEEPITDIHTLPGMVRLRAERIGNIESLHYTAVSSEPVALQENEVEIEVFASGVNFKEVAVTIGIVPENEFLLGGEGAGVIKRVAHDVTKFVPGQRVAFFEKGSFANRVITKTEAVIGIEDSMSFVDAATIPCVFMTSYYALVHLARVRAGDTVLIHSAAGGVGNAAIQLCRHLGATVYATVGSSEKRQFLRESHGLPDDRIFNSRTPGFGARILEHTAGRGVNVVLNSLTGDLLNESWRIVADGGTMVEIGKKDILDRKSLSMEPFHRNASFRALDLSHKEISDEMIARLLKSVFDLVKAGSLKPIYPVRVFTFRDIRSAFRLMRTGRHVGKLVISDEADSDDIPKPVLVRPAPRLVRLQPEKSYVIVGGLRGLCSSLAIYLARTGAKYLTVMSRSGDSGVSPKILEHIRALGCDVQLCKGDVTRKEDVNLVLRNTKAPVGGIVQGAMVLRDRTFAGMTAEEYHDALQCKVQGTWNLHEAALDMGLSLDFFTLLSSISGVCGSKGQANYAAANAFLDAFAMYRSQTLKQATTSLSLGVIEDVGYMAEHEALQDRYNRQVWHPLNERLLRKAFGFSIMQQDAQHAPNPSSAAHMVTGIRIPQPAESSPLQSDARFSFLFSGGPGPDGAKGQQLHEGSTDRGVRAVLVMIKAKAEERAVVDATVDVLGKYLAKSLRLSQDLNPNRPLSTYGIDSLAAVEFRNFVKSELGVELTTLEVVSASSLTAISRTIITKISATS